MVGLEVPGWVTRGSGAVHEGERRAFVGVGSVHGIRNPALARSTADNRARAQIAKIFSTYSASLMRDYAASTAGGGGEGRDAARAREEQDVEQAIKTFSAATLSGVEIADHWYHPHDGSVFSLARLDLDGFTAGLDQLREVSEKARDFVRGHAEAAHRQLEEEEARSLSR